jgi:hypothetical protein
MSAFEPSRIVLGTAMTQLPASSGVLKQVTVGLRAAVDIASSASMAVSLGSGLLTLSVPNVAAVATNYTNVLAPPAGGFAALNALNWRITAAFIAHDGVQTIAYELFLDVEWYPATGFQALIL